MVIYISYDLILGYIILIRNYVIVKCKYMFLFFLLNYNYLGNVKVIDNLEKLN